MKCAAYDGHGELLALRGREETPIEDLVIGGGGLGLGSERSEWRARAEEVMCRRMVMRGGAKQAHKHIFP